MNRLSYAEPSPETKEVCYDPEFFAEVSKAISRSGNHEAKGLLLLYYFAVPDASMDFREFAGLKRKNNFWVPDNDILLGYSKRSLEPGGQIARISSVSYGSLNSFRLTDYGNDFVVPLNGLLLEWGLRHPHVSVQQVFGTGATRTEATPAEIRIEMLTELLTNPESDASFSTLIHTEHSVALGRSRENREYLKRVDKNVRAWEEAGFVERKNIPVVKRGTKQTKVIINDKYREALEDLFGIIVGVATRDETILAYGRSVAQEIASSPEAKIALIEKAGTFSPNRRRRSPETMGEELLGILAVAGTRLSLTQVAAAHQAAHDHTPSIHTIGVRLRELASAGKIWVEDGPPPTQTKFYGYKRATS